MWKGIGIWAVLWAFCWSPAAQAKDVAVDLELVLAVDISGSIDELEARLQREGYINAILHPDVLGAIKGDAAPRRRHLYGMGGALPAETGRLAPDRGRGVGPRFCEEARGSPDLHQCLDVD